jgi:hypothetical protein
MLKKKEMAHIMVRVFKLSDYNYNVRNMLEAIHSWLLNSKGINIRKNFYIKVEQHESMEFQKGVDEYD